MNKGAILASMVVIALASVLAGAGTMAFFSDTGKSTENVFTAGTLDIKLANEGGEWSDEVYGTWTMDNMCPGSTYNGTLYIHNAGTCDIKCLTMDVDIVDYDTGKDGSLKLDDYLHVKRVCVKYDGHDMGCGCCYDYDVTLRAFCDRWEGKPWTDGHIDDDLVQCIARYPDGVFPPCHQLSIKLFFEFVETLGDQNDAQGDSVTLKFTFAANSLLPDEVPT